MKPINEKVANSLRALLADGRRITTGTVAKHAGVSAPTAYNALTAMVEAGTLEHVGAGRGAHFRVVQPSLIAFTEPREGLSEDDVWSRVSDNTAIKRLRSNVRDILHHAFTEMVNNAIDHSMGSSVSVAFFRTDQNVSFEVVDDGIGIFENVKAKFALKTPFEAIGELQKGKVTSQPQLHSGEGIFFTSKMADRMTIESHRTGWIIDNTQPDNMAVVQVTPRISGTRVRFELSMASSRTTVGTFEPFTDDNHAWTKTRTVIHLFREGNQIVSRSEAKRLLVGLEKFREVELDFRGIDGIGQGFADEVFRVWALANPETKLIPTNANGPVSFMIAHARSTGDQVVVPGTARLTITPGTTVVTVGTASGANTTMTTGTMEGANPD